MDERGVAGGSEPTLRIALWGATGAAGRELLRQCLADGRVGSIVAFTRRPLDIDIGIEVEARRLQEVIVEDFLDLSQLRSYLRGMDAAFWCLGVSQSAVPRYAEYREITVDYVMTAARALREESPAVDFHFLSGMGADPSGHSRMMWARVKGEAENMLEDLGFSRLTVWRPGYIQVVAGREGKVASGERFMARIAPLLAVVPGMVNTTVDLAQAMLQVAFDPQETGTVAARRITALAQSYRQAYPRGLPLP